MTMPGSRTPDICRPDVATLAGMIDHTNLKADARATDIERLCREASEYGFGAVMVNPCDIQLCCRLLAGTSVHVGTVAGFPLGRNVTAVKEHEIRNALELGADEVDMVINVGALRDGDERRVRGELEMLSQVCRSAGAVSKTILETCFLTDEEICRASRWAAATGVNFVKTSTGMASGGATAHHVRLMAAAVEGRAAVKAAGGIRTSADAWTMIQAGATRLGTSAGPAIMRDWT